MTTLDVYKEWLGIPEAPRPPGHYELLRLVPFEDDLEKVRNNYKKLNAHVRKYASGKYSIRSQELLNELAKAMLCLTDPERKREYDESLGRVAMSDSDQVGAKSFLKVLLDRKVITRAQMKEVETFAEARGLSIRDAAVQMKLADAPTAAQALAEELGRPFIDLADVLPDDTVLDKVPRATVRRYSCLPLFVDNDQLLVACVDEPAQQLEEEIQLRFGMPMRAVIATPLSINQGIAKYYAAGMRNEAAVETIAGDGKKRTTTRSKSAKVYKRYRELTPEEQQHRTQIGYIIICWGIAGSWMVDNFLLKGRLIPWKPGHALLGNFPFDQLLLTFFIPPLVIWWVYKVYWK